MPLKSREVAGRQPGPHLLITGGVHGDEFESIAAIHKLIDTLDADALTGRVTLVPIVNEAAFFCGARTAEADGLDLARVCPGNPSGSVTERAAHAVSELIRGADLFVDLHTGGTKMCVLPLAGYGLSSDATILHQQRRMARAFNLPVIWGTHPGLDGRTLSVARDAGVPAIYAEYLGGARCCAAGVTTYVDGCLNIMAEFGMLDRPQPTSRIEHIVEDHRPQSGFMQISHPAPKSGFFTAAVELGETVRQGDVLGVVTDVLGQNPVAVCADHAGIVLVMQTFCRAREGTGLAVVLRMSESVDRESFGLAGT
ncbi:MAG: M14 family metallopeptidase [Planctomycetota bacterium]|nr:M14 family metallopeptidase [Planctomycetota bacterium]